MTVRFGFADVARLADKLRDVPLDMRRQVRKRVAEAGGEVLVAVRGAASWSSRIPAATTMRTTFAHNREGVEVRVSARKAPHARPLEFGSQGNPGVVRHPLFGDEDHWVEQPTRPFFMRTVASKREATLRKVEQAVDDALRGI